MNQQPFERELATYRRHFQQLSAEQGRYVLIHKDDILELFDCYEDAVTAGYERIGVEPFLVKRIQPNESIHHFTHSGVGACHT